jgi:hypothetical protein
MVTARLTTNMTEGPGTTMRAKDRAAKAASELEEGIEQPTIGSASV